jgi:putative ABC transport system permease protein
LNQLKFLRNIRAPRQRWYAVEFRMAWREIRPTAGRFAFMVAAIALGVGSLTGIKGFSQALQAAMLRSARDLIASDLSVRLSSSPNKEETAILESLDQYGVALTRITETLSMVSATKGQPPILSSIKAVDPAIYPFYGKVVLEPDAPLSQALADDSVVASQDLLIRSGLAIGDRVNVGGGSFRISAILKEEPDRLASGVDLGPRLLMTRGGLSRTQLIRFGSRATETFLYKLPSGGLDLDAARIIVETGIRRRVRIADFRDPNPSLSSGLERMTTFLSLIGLLALLVGGLGVATTIHSFLQQKLDTIAIIKCLGGRSIQIIRIYLIQGLALGTLGSLLGIVLGYMVQILFPRFLSGLLDLPTVLVLAPGVALQGLLAGVVTTALFLLPPLLATRKIRPARVFLRDMPESRYSTLGRLGRDRLSLLSAVLLLTGTGLLASWLAESLLRGFVFIAGLAAAILLLSIAAKILLSGLKRIPRLSSLALRHGLRNLNRPGSHVASVLVALGIGVAFVLTVYFIQTSLISQVVKGAPANFPNLFLLAITERDKTPLWDFLKSQPGVTDAGIPIPSVPARLLRINGRTADESDIENPGRRYFQTEFALTWSASLPPDTKLLQGHWWKPPYEPAMISVGEHASRELKIGLGSTLEFAAGGQTISGSVENIRDIEFSRPGASNQFIFSPGALEGSAASYIGAIRAQPEHVAELQKALFVRFPGVTSIDAGQVLVRVQELLVKIVRIIRFVALFSIIAGVTILASSVVATRYQRIREAALLKTLGATRALISRIQAAEFLVIGLAAGTCGGLLAAGAAHYLLGTLLNTEFDFQWMPLLFSAIGTAALAIITGWIANRGVLNHRPLEVLREN